MPVVSARDMIKALHKMGYDVDHQTGSHIILRKKQYPHRRLCVPNHKEIARGTLRSIIKESGLEMKEFLSSQTFQEKTCRH
ncbi:MAG: type II toxin-antitoxin system HicA family toxin [Nitrosopumilus sp.]|nr:type II toxin-antitoxin system HicA family toxin [Nitrosopumilus sp.]